jgi:hypothetical protein
MKNATGWRGGGSPTAFRPAKAEHRMRAAHGKNTMLRRLFALFNAAKMGTKAARDAVLLVSVAKHSE